MNALKHWGWTLLMAACCLWVYVWIETGDVLKFSDMENFELVATTVAIVCVLLGSTVFLIVKAINQHK